MGLELGRGKSVGGWGRGVRYVATHKTFWFLFLRLNRLVAKRLRCA